VIATLTISTRNIELAGGNGRQSEAVRLSMSPQPIVQTVSYVGAVEARQIPRAGMTTTVSFESSTEFQSLQAAEYFVQKIGTYLNNLSARSMFLGSLNSLGTQQVETTTAVGTTTGAGNVTIVITSAILDVSPLTIQVPVLLGDTASVWAGKVRTALIQNGDVSSHYNVGGSTTSISLTARKAAANDSTLNISIANGSPSPGITGDGTSDNTTAGVAPTFHSSQTIYEAFPSISATQLGVTVNLSVGVVGRLTA
jgi:phage tail sheath gpL-like